MIKIAVIIGLVAFGDSYTVGAPYADFAEPGYIYQFASQHRLKVRNLAQGGTQLFDHLKQAHANLPPNRTELAILGGSFHDVRRGGRNVKTFTKVAHLYRAWLANAFLKDITPASAGVNSGMVRAFPDSSHETLGLRSHSSGGYAMAGGGGNSLAFKVRGSHIVVGYVIADGIVHRVGRFRVSIDGVEMGVIDPNGKSDGLGYYPGGYDQTRIPAAAIFKAKEGIHTVLIEPLESQQTGPWSIIDYVGTLVPPQKAAPIIVTTPPKMNAAGYELQAPQWSNASDELIALQGTVLRGVAHEFSGYPIAIVETNDFFNLATDVYYDNAHPNLLGHRHLREALNSAIRAGNRTGRTRR